MGLYDVAPVGWDGHLLLLYHTEAQRRSGLTSWLRRGLDAGVKLLYTELVTERPGRSVRSLLTDNPETLAALGRGQVDVIEADDASVYDLDNLTRRIDHALDEGYPEVWWSGEARSAWSLMSQEQHAEIEAGTDELCRTRPVSVTCQYSARQSTATLEPVCSVHGDGVRERLFQAWPLANGLALAGEIDRSNYGALLALLRAATARHVGTEFELDLRRLHFMDVSGTRAIMSGTAQFRLLGGHVRLRGVQRQVLLVTGLLKIGEARGVQVEET